MFNAKGRSLSMLVCFIYIREFIFLIKSIDDNSELEFISTNLDSNILLSTGRKQQLLGLLLLLNWMMSMFMNVFIRLN
jgi:hypothetical protein